MSASRKPIGGILMDQTAVAGVGNIYRAEILFKVRRGGRGGEKVGKKLYEAKRTRLKPLVLLKPIRVQGSGQRGSGLRRKFECPQPALVRRVGVV